MSRICTASPRTSPWAN